MVSARKARRIRLAGTVSSFPGQDTSYAARRRRAAMTLNLFTPSQDPAEGLGVLMLFRLVEEAVPAFFRADRRLRIVRAPGRLDVLGDGRDGAPALHLATAEACCAAVQARDDDLVRLWSPCRDGSRSQLLSMRLRDLGLPGPGLDDGEARALLTSAAADRWAGIVLGGLRLLAQRRGLQPAAGCELLLHSDVPEGRGAGASAAVAVAALRALALHFAVELAVDEVATIVAAVERDLLGLPASAVDAVVACAAAAGELLLTHGAGAAPQSLVVPSDLEFVALDSGPRAPVAPLPPAPPEPSRVARCLELLGQAPSPAARHELGDLMFASHAGLAAAGRSSANADFVVATALQRRAAGGAVFGARLSGSGGGGAVVLCGEQTKVWYEALRIKKALAAATGHSAHVFRWSSPGAFAFGSIDLLPNAR